MGDQPAARDAGAHERDLLVLDQPYTLRASGIKGNACARSGAFWTLRSQPASPYLQRLEAVERTAQGTRRALLPRLECSRTT